jgi:hypothetical protein
LNEAINAGLADPKMKARVADLGGTALEAPGVRAAFQVVLKRRPDFLFMARPAFGFLTPFRTLCAASIRFCSSDDRLRLRYRSL